MHMEARVSIFMAYKTHKGSLRNKQTSDAEPTQTIANKGAGSCVSAIAQGPLLSSQF